MRPYRPKRIVRIVVLGNARGAVVGLTEMRRYRPALLEEFVVLLLISH